MRAFLFVLLLAGAARAQDMIVASPPTTVSVTAPITNTGTPTAPVIAHATAGSAGTTGDASHVAQVTTNATGHVTGTSAVPIAISAAAVTSGTLAQGVGGTGAGALTCAVGESLTSNGTAYSCAAASGGLSQQQLMARSTMRY